MVIFHSYVNVYQRVQGVQALMVNHNRWIGQMSFGGWSWPSHSANWRIVGGDWNMNGWFSPSRLWGWWSDDPILLEPWNFEWLSIKSWEFHHPNWLSYFSDGLKGVVLFLATDVILPTWSLRAIIRCSFRISSPGVAFMTAKHGSVLHCKIEPQETILLKVS